MNTAIVMVLFLLSLLQLGCGSARVLRDNDYSLAMASARQGQFDKALSHFPTKRESGGFITTLERSYLKMFSGERATMELDKNFFHQLQIQTKTFSERNYLSITRETDTFFFQESPDGYVPSEHEVVLLHLLSAQALMIQNQTEEAQVELRRASFLLQGTYAVTPQGENRNIFDDPALRIWLASLWAASGDWESARVDLRRAAELSSGQTGKENLLHLAGQPKGPPTFNLTLKGVGPDLNWKENSFEPEFRQFYVPPVTHSTQDVEFSTDHWYQRHLQRNSSLRDTLLKSNYMAQFVEVKAGSGAKTAGKGLVVGAVGVAGLAVLAGAGVLTVYVISAGGSGTGETAAYILGGGLLWAKSIWNEGDRFDSEMTHQIQLDERESLERMRTYRFVRFLPQAISLNWSLQSTENSQENTVNALSIGHETKLTINLNPNPSCSTPCWQK